jgi:hypothetical protein
MAVACHVTPERLLSLMARTSVLLGVFRHKNAAQAYEAEEAVATVNILIAF